MLLLHSAAGGPSRNCYIHMAHPSRPMLLLLRLAVNACSAMTLTMPAPGRVVAVGDVHGDVERFVSTLQNAALIVRAL